jgi:hypothetical protein
MNDFTVVESGGLGNSGIKETKEALKYAIEEVEELQKKLDIRNSALMEIRDAAPWGSDTPDYDLQLWMRGQADKALNGQYICPIIIRKVTTN